MILEYYSINWRLRGELVFINLRLSDVIVLIVFTWYLLKIIVPAVILALGLDARYLDYAHCSAHVLISQDLQDLQDPPDLSDDDMMI